MNNFFTYTDRGFVAFVDFDMALGEFMVGPHVIKFDNAEWGSLYVAGTNPTEMWQKIWGRGKVVFPLEVYVQGLITQHEATGGESLTLESTVKDAWLVLKAVQIFNPAKVETKKIKKGLANM